VVFRDSGMRRFLSIGDSTRSFNTLRNLALHDVSRWVLVGVLAVEFHCLRVENSHAIRHLNDIDFVATAFECIPETLARDFLFRHVHPFDPPCKTMMQLVDADTSLRVDVFRTNGEIMSRAILVDGPSGPIRVISVEDVVACEARLLLDLAASVPVPAKHANDYLRLADLVKSSNLETAWQDHRKPTHPMTFGETSTLLKGLIATRRNLLINLEYSKDTAEICPVVCELLHSSWLTPISCSRCSGIARQFWCRVAISRISSVRFAPGSRADRKLTAAIKRFHQLRKGPFRQGPSLPSQKG
jgi:hypothetical protein